MDHVRLFLTNDTSQPHSGKQVESPSLAESRDGHLIFLEQLFVRATAGQGDHVWLELVAWQPRGQQGKLPFGSGPVQGGDDVKNLDDSCFQ